jgi:hypothetical protein
LKNLTEQKLVATPAGFEPATFSLEGCFLVRRELDHENDWSFIAAEIAAQPMAVDFAKLAEPLNG